MVSVFIYHTNGHVTQERKGEARPTNSMLCAGYIYSNKTEQRRLMKQIDVFGNGEQTVSVSESGQNLWKATDSF